MKSLLLQGLQGSLIPVSNFVIESEVYSTDLVDASLVRKRQFLSGRMAAHKALEKLGMHDVCVRRSETGAPIWPNGTCGSLSHTETQACAVVGLTEQYASIGLDIEPISSISALAELRCQFLSSEEDSKLSDRDALLAFSAKEALYKLLSPLTHQYFGFEAAEVSHISSDEVTLSLRCQVGAYASKAPFAVRYAFFEGHVVTLVFIKERNSSPRSQIAESA